MSYLKPSASSIPLDPEDVTRLARLAGLTVPSEDVEPLTEALRNQLASIEQLEELDLTDVNPSLEFNPLWRD